MPLEVVVTVTVRCRACLGCSVREVADVAVTGNYVLPERLKPDMDVLDSKISEMACPECGQRTLERCD